LRKEKKATEEKRNQEKENTKREFRQEGNNENSKVF
jgi:hypothetical protein